MAVPLAQPAKHAAAAPRVAPVTLKSTVPHVSVQRNLAQVAQPPAGAPSPHSLKAMDFASLFPRTQATTGSQLVIMIFRLRVWGLWGVL